MPGGDYLILMGVGGLFIILGLGVMIWGRHEEKSYFNSLSTRTNDLREFVSHWPPRPQPGSLKLGGWLAVAIGLLMVVVSVILLLWARSNA